MSERALATADRSRSPLLAFRDRFRQASDATGQAICLQEVANLAQVNLRGDAGHVAFRKAVQSVIGTDLPVEPNTSISTPYICALWLGPDEWLLVNAADSGEMLVAPLRKAIGSLHGSAIDVSDARAVIDLSGTQSRNLLYKGCSFDLHERTFLPGHCAQTNLARANILLHLLNAKPTWRLYVRTSFAYYLASWLLDATVEYSSNE